MKKLGKKRSLYVKSLLFFTGFLAILGVIFLIYATKSLIAYENADEESYMKSLTATLYHSAKRNSLSDYVTLSDITSPYEKNSSLNKGYAALLKDATYKRLSKNTYEILSKDNQKIFTVTLDDSKILSCLAILSYVDYDIKEITAYNEEGLYNLELYINSDYSLYINDVKVLESDLVSNDTLKQFKDVQDLITLPKVSHYQIKNLTYEPKIVIKDQNNKNVEYEIEDGIIYANSFYTTDSKEEAMQKLSHEYNPLEMAENYSLFLTSENLSSGKAVSFVQLSQNLIENTDLYNKIRQYATGVDRTFMSFHSNDKDTFTNEKLSNFTIYNENAFAVDIYLEKNMTLADKQKRTDILNERYYFIYYEGAWRLVYTESKGDK